MTGFTASEVMFGRAMAPVTVTRAIAPETIGSALRDLMAAILRPLRRWAIIDRLERLDDRMLDDIGVRRYDIDAIAQSVASRQAPGIGAAVGNLFASLARIVVAWSERRAAYRELSGLEDRMLTDIGITRSDIPAVISGMAARATVGESADPFEIVRRWLRSRAAAQDLNALDDRALDDIGMVRGDIDWVAEEPATRSLRPANTNQASRVA